MSRALQEIDSRIADLRVDIRASQRLLEELEKIRKLLPPDSIQSHTRRTTGKGHAPGTVHTETKELILGILEKAGRRGMTTAQLAEIMNTPQGTASSRLSLMKKEGLITHQQPYYFFPGPTSVNGAGSHG